MFVDAYLDRGKDIVHVSERVNGTREYKQYPVNFEFYYDDPRGKYKTIFNTPVAQFQTRSRKEFTKEIKINSDRRLYESDVNPVIKCLSTNYRHADSPELNVCFFDIETDFNPSAGFISPSEPSAMITAITAYLSQHKKAITLAIPPKTMSSEEANLIAGKFNDTYMFNKETDMLEAFLDLIEDSDVLTGWNSEGYDIPYTVNRITRVMSKNDTRRMCLWDQYPKKREFEKFGGTASTYDLIGRIHLDYLELYRKYTYHEMHSNSLDAVSEYELNDSKVPYEGTLDNLYHNEFEKFIAYNRQDVMLIVKLDKKLQFISLANDLAHSNTVLIPTTMGAVAVTEQAIINEAHDKGLVVPNKPKRRTKEGSVAGAYVATPQKGLHKWIGSVDINSLYPSAIRAINMGPETIVGQLRPTMTDDLIMERYNKQKGKTKSFGACWEGLFATIEYTAVMEKRPDTNITIDWEDGTETVLSAIEICKMVFDPSNQLIMSANGTLFTSSKKGIIPGLLERWYAERTEMQKTKTNWKNLEVGIEIPIK